MWNQEPYILYGSDDFDSLKSSNTLQAIGGDGNIPQIQLLAKTFVHKLDRKKKIDHKV